MDHSVCESAAFVSSLAVPAALVALRARFGRRKSRPAGKEASANRTAAGAYVVATATVAVSVIILLATADQSWGSADQMWASGAGGLRSMQAARQSANCLRSREPGR
jgi:hypothetical protein